MINFLRYQWLSGLVSVSIFVAFIGGFFYKRAERGSAFVYSVDFTGGTQVLFGFSAPVTSNQVVSVLEKDGMAGAVTREFSPTEILIRVHEHENDANGLAVRIKESLEKELSGITVTIKQTDSVGGGIGAALRYKSIQAVLAALVLMLLYIWFRFWSLAYAVGNVVSLFHDAIVILTFFMWFDWEISLNVIGAILAILGYSINDTIVIFSRIRENIGRMRNESIERIINVSTNETLRRTLLTSFATSLVVLALLLFGGEALRTLALALFIGIVFGTYSSIYIASPCMLLLYRK